jgi:hypothetical protein
MVEDFYWVKSGYGGGENRATTRCENKAARDKRLKKEEDDARNLRWAE